MSLELSIARVTALDSLPERECTRCGEWKSPAAFPADAGKRSGLDSRCLGCHREKAVRLRAKRKAENAGKDPYSDPSLKRCPDCGRDLPRTDFPRDATERDGLRGVCRSCHSRRNTEWKRENPERNRAHDRAKNRRRRARKRANGTTPYDESAVFAENFWTCVYCGGEAEEVDHFFPISRGGPDAPENVVGTCRECNRGRAGKFDRDPLEFLKSRGFRFGRVVIVSD